MGKYEELAPSIVENVGGKENVLGLTHCVTRLRFKLRDESKANDEAFENMDGVVSLIKQGGQYQVVIGPAVEDAYNAVMPLLDFDRASAQDAPAEGADAKQGVGAIVLDFLTSALGPTLGLICAGGIIKGLVALLQMTGVLVDGTLLCGLLNAAGDAVYYFMPVVICYSLSIKLKMDPVTAIVIGLALVYPSIQNMEGASLFGVDYSGVSYTQTMFPAIFIMIAAAPFDHFLNRTLPASIKSFLRPALDLLVIVPLGYLVIGPVANMLSTALGGFIGGIYDVSPILCGIVLCGLWQVLVLFGIHMGLAAVIFTGMFAVGYSALYPMTCIPCFTQLGICLAIYLRSKDAKLRELALPATISAAFGTTEPAIYGITLPRIKYFVMSCVISAIAGAWLGLTNVLAYQLGGNGFLCLTIVMKTGETANLINFAIGIVFALVASFAITMVTYRDKSVASA